MTRLRTTPFDAHLVVPERGLGTVPAILKQSYVTGRLQADVKASGTVQTPKVDVTASLRSADYTGNGTRGLPLDIDVVAHYDGVRGTASVKAHSTDKQLLDLEGQVDVAVAALLGTSEAGNETSPAWKASSHAHITGFPMGSIAALDDKLVAGQLSGDISVVDLHANAHAAGAGDPGDGHLAQELEPGERRRFPGEHHRVAVVGVARRVDANLVAHFVRAHAIGQRAPRQQMVVHEIPVAANAADAADQVAEPAPAHGRACEGL